ncbi:MAG TPA: DsbA family protein [Steroidobacteraceae bacterium]|jgi:predicted DsbA family dithiol-disulfide isomerase|nr:DsbA family protein [Steroidobacteraceae bacterium]
MDTQIVTPAPARPILELDLIADFACPWSFLGKRSLERALGNLYGLPVRALRWHGFRAKPEGLAALALGTAKNAVVKNDATADVASADPQQSWRAHLATRLPSGVSVDFAHKSLAEAGEGLGIHFDFSRLERVPDTREAHRLVALAAREEKHSETADSLFRAFFEQGRDIGDRAVVEAVGREVGLSADTLAAFGKPEEGRDEIAADEKRLIGFGVVATPNLLINGRVLVPGPADSATYVQALDQALFPELPAGEKKQLH